MNKYLKFALPLTMLIVGLAFALPEQISCWRDRQLLDNTYVWTTEEQSSQLSDSIRLTVPEKLLLLQSGDLSVLKLEEGESGNIRLAIVNGEAVFYESQEPQLQKEQDQDAVQLWSERLEDVRGEMRILQHLGAIPRLWSEESTVETANHREVLYIDNDTQISFVVYYMDLMCAPYKVSLMVDAQTGTILSASLRWAKGAPPSWGAEGAASFGSAWRDYWDMDDVDAAWNSERIKEILTKTEEKMGVNGEYTSMAELKFTYNGQSLTAPLYGWAASRECGVQWNSRAAISVGNFAATSKPNISR